MSQSKNSQAFINEEDGIQDYQTKKEFPKFEVADIGAEQTLPTDMIIEQKGKEKVNENDLVNR